MDHSARQRQSPEREMPNGLSRLRRTIQPSFGPAGNIGPLFRPPSHAEVVETVVSEVLGHRTIVAVRGGEGVGKTTLVHCVASKLRTHGRTAVTINAGSANPGMTVQILGQALGVEDADLLAADALLQRMRTWEGSQRLVLLIDDADLLSSAMFRTLALLIKLFDLRPMTLQIVLVGQPGQWPGVQAPDLETMRRATLSLHTIAAAALHNDRAPDEGGLADLVAADGLRRTPSRRSRNRVAIAVFGLLMTGVATAELIELSEGAGPSQDVTHAVDVGPSVPPPAAGNAAETASEALPRIPSPEGTPGPKLSPPPGPTPRETRVVQETPATPDGTEADSGFSLRGGVGGPGLVLVAGAGDDLPGLYAKVYRGVTPPPYPQVVAANRLPMKPGALVVFPEPPSGWPR